LQRGFIVGVASAPHLQEKTIVRGLIGGDRASRWRVEGHASLLASPERPRGRPLSSGVAPGDNIRYQPNMALKHILIAVPTMGGIVKSKTTATLVLLMRQLTRAGVAAEFLNIDSSDIVYARNFYAKLVLNSKNLDGLLFVDSDMHFRPGLVLRMLNLGSDVVATAYPKRALDMDQFAQEMAAAGEFSPKVKAKALADTYQYTVVPSWTSPKVGRMDVVNGFVKMAGAGMGCTLISRAALEIMIDGGAVARRKDIIDGVNQESWGFFDCMSVDGVTLSEDFSFCYRWTCVLGRDLWVNVDEAVTHLGDFSYQARYLDRLTRVGPAPGVGAAPAAAPRAEAFDIEPSQPEGA
jgi:hypothetical protein